MFNINDLLIHAAPKVLLNHSQGGRDKTLPQ